ncbi:MAG: hypothetical protein PVG35_03635 [Desulfobacterales bacterium]|jgi:hypothetical protein
MDSRLDAKIQKEIRRRALQRADELRHERQLNVKTLHTIAALQEVTGLQRPELESIAEAVKRSFRVPCDTFFSIKRQTLITIGIFGSILVLSGLMSLI